MSKILSSFVIIIYLLYYVPVILSINCQFVGVPFVTGGVGVGVAERLFKAKYPATPAKTTTRIINAMFANPFWFISLIIAKLIIDFDFRIKKFSSPKIKIWFEPIN